MKLILGTALSCAIAFSSVDINKANVDQITSLKGIGSAKALKIVEYIKQNGCFESVEDLTKVKGIGQGFIEKNKNEIIITSCKD